MSGIGIEAVKPCPEREPIASRIVGVARREARHWWSTTGCDVDDLAQELTAALWRASHSYDPDRAAPATYLAIVARRHACSVFRTQDARKRRPVGARVISIHDVVNCAGSLTAGGETPDPADAVAMRLDVRQLVDSLPCDLRALCHLLQTHPPASAARMLGLSRGRLQGRLKALRMRFELAGLKEDA